jgi:ribosome-associated translation inhibitor RaiA
MQIQVNTDHNIEGREALSAHIHEAVERALGHERTHITRVEVHVADENGPKTGPKDLRCTMEARLERHQPIVVTCEAATLHQSIEGAAEKLARLIGHTLGKRRDESRHRTDPSPAGPETPASP